MYRGFFKVKLIFLIGSKKLVQIIGKFLISLVFLLICLLFDVLNQNVAVVRDVCRRTCWTALRRTRPASSS